MLYTTSAKSMIKQWYWCGVFGELYGAANETRYANDISQVIKWITNNGDLPKTVTDFFFNPTRLLSLQTRQSAAYKGIMAFIIFFQNNIALIKSMNKAKWNSIINKTPISARSNREIGGVAPSVYLGKLEKKGSVFRS